MDVAVIMMTAFGSEDVVVECMKSGAVDYFSKPFSLDDMLPRDRTRHRQPAGPAE